MFTFIISLFLTTFFYCATGRKKKEQHDASNPAYAGAYGAAPPVSILLKDNLPAFL